MHPQLQAIADEFRAAQRRLHRLAHDVPDERWAVRPAPERWSPAECVEHLNLTAEAFLPPLREAIEEGRRNGIEGTGPYRRDPIGWLLWKVMPPPVRRMRKTGAAFVPTAGRSPTEIRARFDALQQQQIDCLASADGLDLQRLKLRSPFDGRVHYNLYSALSILPRHQERHIWQAERAASAT